MIDPARWARIEQLFDQAEKLPSDQRAAFLAAECGPDDALRQEVESLLAAAGPGDPALGAAVADAWATAAHRIDGTRIGPYQIIRELGRGGMGAVFLAERADGAYEGTVAIKVTREGMANADLLRRLRTERQILASLQHPNIARLLDGGTTDRGVPYVVMEYVEGARIDRYCDEHRLSVRDRLELIRILASAVEHANRNLVVHRDIKPSNILVTADGTPKLLDFGIAKLLEEGDGDVTRTAIPLLTPAYASPEQIAGEQITTASDVYSLGMVCYEILTGRLPYQVSGARSAADLARIVSESQVTRPSDAVTEEPTSDVAARRSSTADQLRRTMSGDLDAILLTALRKEPERRYRSAGDFAADLGRYLEGRPVQARPDTFGYRTAKFVQRHRLGVTATVAAAAALIGAVAFYTNRLASERNRAVAERTKAEHVTAFLTSVFALANPEETGGRQMTAVDLLNRGAQRVRDSLDADPETQAAMMHTIAQAYVKLGQTDSARRLFDDALARRERALGPESPEVAQTLMALGEWYYEKGIYDSAETFNQRAVAIQAKTLGDDDPARALGLYNLGWISYTRGNLQAADSLTRQSLAARIRIHGVDHPETAESQNSLGVILFQLGQYQPAESLLRTALATREKHLGPSNPLTEFVVNNLAVLLEARGELVAAESLYRRVVTTDTALYGPDSPRASTGYINLGRTLGALDRYQEAEAAMLEALRIDSLQNPDHPYVAYDLRTLADMKLGQQEYPAAERYYQRALSIYRKNTDDPIATGSALRGLAMVRLRTDRPTEAVALLREARPLWQALPDDHPDKAHLLGLLGLALLRQGSVAEAESLLVPSERALAAVEGRVGQLRTVRDALAELYRATGRAAAADSLAK
ncbi:MAG: tetratricopeptide repeat protein [Gemmatimonadales bacterium]